MDLTQIKDLVRQAASLKDQSDLLNKRHSEIKGRLTEAIDELGETDGRGHITLEVDDTVSGIKSISKQRRVSQSIDIEVAEALLAAKGLTEDCVKQVPVLDEDAIMSAYYQNKLSEEDIDKMFPKKISYAFIMNKG